MPVEISSILGVHPKWYTTDIHWHAKKGKANFDSLVAKCISRDLLTTDRIRKFSRQARSYMLTYSSLQFIHEDKGQEQVMMNNTFTHTKIKNMKKY